MKLSPLFSLACILLPVSLRAEAVQDREGAVRADRAQMAADDRWIYNDVERGFAEAAKTGKPLLVVLRCVPCKACMGIDASILRSPALAPLLERFVCVRVINANALDLALFQFDYDLSFSTLFFNADRTVYGRYGSWQHQREAADATTAGYQAALAAVLAIHHDYPANKASLAAKQGGPAPFRVPVEIPTLAGKYERELNWDGKVAQSCVHCHQIGDAFRAWYRRESQPIPRELLYPMPAPETIGLTLDPQFPARVTAVAAGSPAASAGFGSGDDLLALEGAPVVSIADVAWTLHRLPESGVLRATVRRAGAKKSLVIPLPEGWRMQTDIASRVGTWQLRAMATGGLVLLDLTDAERLERGLGLDRLALQVKSAGAYGPHGEARKAGFQKDDVLVAVDGGNERATESQFLGRLLLAHPVKTALKCTILRGQGTLELMLPMQ